MIILAVNAGLGNMSFIVIILAVNAGLGKLQFVLQDSTGSDNMYII